MDSFWLKKARQYIEEHNSFRSVSEIQYEKEGGSADISADLFVNLPGSFLAAGITTTGIRSTEPVYFIFYKDFPLKAPKIVLREDFPRCFPHINPSVKEVLPCIYEGDLSELLQQSEWMNGILNQLVDWMERAASGSLMNYSQGWEPMRNDYPAGFTMYDTAEILDFLKNSQIGSREIYYENRKKLIFTGSLCDSSKKKKSTVFVCRSSDTQAVDRYSPNKILNLTDLYRYAHEIGISDLKKTVEDYDIKHLDEDKLFITLAIKRPIKLIGSDSNIELLNFVVHKSQPRKGKKRVLPECKVGMLSHIDKASPTLLKKLSGSKHSLNDTKNIAILGCGSLGSKIGLHLARNGNNPFLCIDQDIFLPHNNARHGLSLTWAQNKADLLQLAIYSITGSGSARAHGGSVSSTDFSNSRLLIDTTASLSVRSYLTSQTNLPPIISCMLFGSGALGVSLIEGKGRQARLDDLWANLYLHSLGNTWLRDILFSDQKNSVLIGQSCSSHTVVMSDANLSLLASNMGLRIQRILEDGFPAAGEIMLSQITDQYGLSSSRYDVAKSIEVPSITKKDWNVRISASVVEKMKDQSTQAGENETGGCLVGSVFLAAKSIVITDILPPPPDSTSSRSLFILGTDGLEAKIKTIERKSNAKVTYLGTWHSHPRGGSASGTDKDTAVRLLFVRHYEPTVCLIWTPDGLIQI